MEEPKADLFHKALTVELTLDPIPLATVLAKTTADYNRPREPYIKAGLAKRLTYGSFALKKHAVRVIRHSNTNYDEVWRDFQIDYDNSDEYQIVYRRTMQMIGDTYPELTKVVKREVDKKLPLVERSIICLPRPLGDIEREVEQSLGSTHSMSESELQNHMVPLIHSGQTDYDALHALTAKIPAVELRDRLTEEVYRATMRAIAVTFPELSDAVQARLDTHAGSYQMADILPNCRDAVTTRIVNPLNAASQALRLKTRVTLQETSELHLEPQCIMGVSLDKLLLLTVQDRDKLNEGRSPRNRHPLIIGGSSQDTADLHLYAVRFAVNNLMNHERFTSIADIEYRKREILKFIAQEYTPLSRAVEDEHRYIDTQDIIHELKEMARPLRSSDVLIRRIPIDELHDGVLTDLNRRFEDGSADWATPPIDIHTNEPNMRANIDDAMLSWVRSRHTNAGQMGSPYISIFPAEESAFRKNEFRQLVNTEIKKVYPELALAVDKKLCEQRLPETVLAQ